MHKLWMDPGEGQSWMLCCFAAGLSLGKALGLAHVDWVGLYVGMGWEWHRMACVWQCECRDVLGRQVVLDMSDNETGFDTPPTEHINGFPNSALCALHILVSPMKY